MTQFALWLTAKGWRLALWCLLWVMVGAGLFAVGVLAGLGFGKSFR